MVFLKFFTPNRLVTNYSVRNIQVFGLYRLNYQRSFTLRHYLKFGLYRISVYSGLGLDRFYCTLKKSFIYLMSNN